jgi:catechol 2,3-dioxygenase-like lactoylglutathione lyase family enzyme
VEVERLIWLGTRTREFEETVRFFHEILELPVGNRRPGFVRLDLSDGGCVEVFDAAAGEYPHFSTGPVPGVVVSDFDRARAELAQQGHELILPVGGEPGEYRWQHFRGPDGLVFELVDYPHRPQDLPPAGSLGITKLIWVGLSTENFEATSRFLRETLALRVEEATEDLTVCTLPDGSAMEVFRRGTPMDHPHFRTGPVLGFRVDDIDRAMTTLQDRGVSFLQSRRRSWGGWAHFRAPDGCVYEIKGLDRASTTESSPVPD